jgi:hypothetical protein
MALDTTGMVAFLRSVPLRNTTSNRSKADIVTLPMPTGGTQRFSITGYSLSGQVIDSFFLSFYGTGIDDPTAFIALEWSCFGFRATTYPQREVLLLKRMTIVFHQAILPIIKKMQKHSAVFAIQGSRQIHKF